jgi:hypothetical protein
MSILPQGPEYAYAERWPARIAYTLLMVPFCLVAYGLGYAVDQIIPDTDFDGYGGAIAVAMFLALTFAFSFGQWLRGFRS